MIIPQKDQIVGVLLAGGQSRRMFQAAAATGNTATGDSGTGDKGTGDKGLLEIAGRPMLGHVIARLAPQVGSMVINANGDPGRFALFGLPVVSDTVSGHVGPLAGVLAGMRWSLGQVPKATHIATASTDAPFVPSDLVARLAASLAPNAPIALAKSNGEMHPVIGLWPVALADNLEAALHRGTRKVLAWTNEHGTSLADFPMLEIGGERIDPFFNANTPDELDEARRLLALGTPR